MHLDDATLNEYLDGRLDKRVAAHADRHLATCIRCRSRLRSLERLTLALEAWPEVELGRDLSVPVVARLRTRTPHRALRWLTILEAVGATGLATYVWPRLVEMAGPYLTGPSMIALTMWVESSRASLMAAVNDLVVGLASFSYAFDVWARQPAQVTGLPMPLVAVLGAAALALGVMGNGLLLRAFPAKLGRTAYPTLE